MTPLQQALQRHQSGDLAGAIQLYQGFLKANPSHPDALHLLGVAQMQSGSLEEAISTLSKATEVETGNPDYFNNLGLAQFYMGDVVSARASYAKALQLNPNSADTLNNMGLALQKLDDPQGAIDHFDRAVRLAPQEWEILHNLGVVLQEAGLLEQAADVLSEAIHQKNDSADSHATLAVVRFGLGDPEAGFEECWKALELDPEHWGAHRCFMDMKLGLEKPEEVHLSYQWACDEHPGNVRLWVGLGAAYAEVKAYQDAEDRLRHAVSIDPNLAEAHSVLGKALFGQERYEEAIEAYQRATELDPEDAATLESYGRCLMQAGQFAEAVPQLERAHRIMPRNNSIMGWLTVAMTETDDPRVEDILDYDRDIVTRFITAPEGFDSVEDFNETLHRELEEQHELRPVPKDQTMQGGTQIPGNVFSETTESAQALRQAIHQTIQDYIADLERDPEHPFLRYLNPKFRFIDSWSTILYGAGVGYDMSHIHVEAWLSGVYYVKIPEFPEEVWETGEGCIQFGEPPDGFVSEKNRTRRLVRPQAGMLALFPSYVWHGVRPFNREGTRHAIAFDVV